VDRPRLTLPNLRRFLLRRFLLRRLYLRRFDLRRFLLSGCALALIGCATRDERAAPVSPDAARAEIARLIPAQVVDRQGWAADLYAALATLDLAVTASNVCAALAVIEQESGYRADPAVPNLAVIARKQIDAQAEKMNVPAFAVRAALNLSSSDGRTYAERLERVQTERELSEIFEDFIAQVPLGTRFLAARNPVRTGGPMQVGIAFAEQQAARKPYPYAMQRSVRNEVFTRRGGLYFGVAHLLGYEAAYPEPIYRFADFNAGHYASRNAAFQRALGTLSGVRVTLDGDLLPPDPPAQQPAGETERVALAIAQQLDLSPSAIRRDLEKHNERAFERTRLYERVFARADALEGRAVPRAVIPTIELKSPKFTRKLTTEWFARRVEARYRNCMGRVQGLPMSATPAAG
jgi:hypothetical protein